MQAITEVTLRNRNCYPFKKFHNCYRLRITSDFSPIVTRIFCCLAFCHISSLFSFQGTKRSLGSFARILRILSISPLDHKDLWRVLLRALTDSRFWSLLKPDTNDQTFLNTSIRSQKSQFYVGGPKWTRTTDLTIISRTL
jgi:hypothetical protein